VVLCCKIIFYCFNSLILARLLQSFDLDSSRYLSKMKFFFVFVVLMVLPFVSASGLRSETEKGFKKAHSKVETKIGSMSYTGTFPTNPVYGSINYYAAGCGTAVTSVENTLTGVCFSDGTTSQKYLCGKFYFSWYS
jgi:outer membrane lipoprotein-sorting protein